MTSTLARDLATPTPNPSPQGGGEYALRRGACPGLSAPMQTGDGLLVRLLPIGTIPLAAFTELCAAARRFGNGIVEITARGSIQVRGLDVASAPRFAAAVAALGIAAEDGVAVHTNPLAGLDPDEIFDAGNLAADLRRALAERALAVKLAPKVSVAIDGGGALNLDRLSADVRLRAAMVNGEAVYRVSIGGDGMSAATLGFVAPANGAESAIRLLDVLARRGCNARARDTIAAEGSAAFRSAVADLLIGESSSCAAPRPGEAIGTHQLLDGSLACGVGLAFGHADASSLECLIEAADAFGASGLIAAPGRALIAVGLLRDAVPEFATAAERLGFIICTDDPRRHVIACAGAPFCASAHLAARTIAPSIAKTAAQFLDKSFSIHVSGCAKGCAHPAPAALTVVGTPQGCALIANGVPRDAPFAVVAPDELTAAIARYRRQLTGEGRHV